MAATSPAPWRRSRPPGNWRPPTPARFSIWRCCMIGRGAREQARKEYEIVIQLQPENATALNNLAYLEAEEGVDLDQALAHAQRAQQKLPGNLDVQDTLALVYIRKNLTNDGIRMLRDLVSQRPDSAPFHLHLALALYQKGDRSWAKRELEAALRHQPSAKEQNQIRELLAKVG